MTCTRCKNSGFLNIHQLPDHIDAYNVTAVLFWMKNPDWKNEKNDVCICDCCGDTEGWYGTPGEHYNNDDPCGYGGPYAYNGGLCECN